MSLAMSTDVEPRGFSLKSFSWSTYDLYSPTYPPSLWSLIFSFHNANSCGRSDPSYDSAVDLGCGSGAAFAMLSHYFRHLTLADPSAHNLDSARTKLSSQDLRDALATQNHTCQLSYSNLPAEERIVPSASQDMITMFEAIHWTNPAPVMAQIAAALKPGGTVALVEYSLRTVIVDNEPAMRVWDEIWQAHVSAVFSGEQTTAKKAHQLAISQAAAGLDFVPLDPGLWKPRARRININCAGSAASLRLCSGNPPTAANVTDAAREQVEWVEGMPGWERDVGRDWFRAYYVDTFQVGTVLPPDHEQRIAPLWERLQEALGPEDVRVKVLWPATLLLATRAEAPSTS